MPPFLRGLKAVGQPKLAADAWVIVAWGQVLTTVKLMNQIGVNRVTSANFAAKIQAFKGPQALGAPSLSCGKYPAEPAACNDQAQFFQYHGAGKFERITGFLRPPPTFKLGAETTSSLVEAGPPPAAPPLVRNRTRSWTGSRSSSSRSSASGPGR